jgi:hypothetical protein
MTGVSRAQAIGMSGELGFPCGGKGWTNQGLSSPIRLGGHAPGAFVRGGVPCGNPHTPERVGLAVETKRVGEAPALRWRQGLGPIDPRRVSPSVILRHATHRQQPSIP